MKAPWEDALAWIATITMEKLTNAVAFQTLKLVSLKYAGVISNLISKLRDAERVELSSTSRRVRVHVRTCACVRLGAVSLQVVSVEAHLWRTGLEAMGLDPPPKHRDPNTSKHLNKLPNFRFRVCL